MLPAHIIPDDKILLGKIIKAHGVRGDVLVYCFSEQPENMVQYTQLFLLDQRGRISVPLSVRSCRVRGKNAIVGFEGINNRNQLAEMLEAGVLIDKKALSALPADQFYWYQYQGREVVTRDGHNLGKITRLFSNGAQDVIVIQAAGRKELLIPVTREILIAEEQERLIIDPPPGLLEINSAAE